jgi:hypothetical protein
MIEEAVIDAFQATTRVSRDAVFDDDRLMPVVAVEHARMAAPGWVGANWRAGGTVLMAINPGGGGDAYKRNPTDDQLYGCISTFREASPDLRAQAFARMSETWIALQRTHNIRRVVDPLLAAVRSTHLEAAFLNVLPFRTRGDRPARSGELRRAWDLATSGQLAALAPKRVVALGRKAYDALIAVGAESAHEVVLIKRSIGDSTLSQQARDVIGRLAAESR